MNKILAVPGMAALGAATTVRAAMGKQTYGLENARSKEEIAAITKELKDAKKYEKETKILNVYGKDPETGKRHNGKILARYFFLGFPYVALRCNQADKIQMKRDIDDLKSQIEELKGTNEQA